VAELFKAHVDHLAHAIDALAAGDVARGYAMLHEATVQTQEIADPLAMAIVRQFPQHFAAGPRACDGQTLALQPAQVQQLFRAVWGDQAEQRWVAEHEREIRCP
jgi:hypothetical protein